MTTTDWRDDCINRLRERNKAVYPFYDIINASSRLQSENDMLERKLITVTRQIAILRHDNTQALSDILLSKPVPLPTTAPLITPTPATSSLLPVSSQFEDTKMNKETCNILIETLDATRASLANIQSELRSINTDYDGREKLQRIILHEKIREQETIINQLRDELELAKEEMRLLLERNAELENKVLKN
jgi:hypothetical protein